MSNTRRPIIYFDYGGYYLRKGNDIRWISKEQVHHMLLVKTTIEEVTYSQLVTRICVKMNVDESKKVIKLSYVPEEVHPKRPTYIFDDDDVICFLEINQHQIHVLHVEVDKDDDEVHEREHCVRGDKIPREDIGSNVGESTEEILSNARVNAENMNRREGGPSTCNESMETHENTIYEEYEDVVNNQIFEVPEVTPHVAVEWEDGMDVTLHEEFQSKKALSDLVHKTAHKNCFEFVVRKSCTRLYVVKCSEAKKGCKWSLRAVKDDVVDTFTVRTYNKMHTCSRVTTSTIRKKKKGSSLLVASVLREDFPCMLSTPSPKDVIPLVHTRVGVKVSYSTALRGKKKAAAELRGTPDDSYKLIYSYMYMLEKMNEGTVSYIETDDENRFKYLFFALGACIEGFQAMRKVISVDGTHIKTAHGGVLIVATAQDPDHHHYPIAFGVVDSENNDSWTWFFTKLNSVVPDSCELVFCSDRNASLIKSVSEVYPLAHHGYCIYHLSQNVKASVKNVNRDMVATKFMECARAYTEGEFEVLYAAFIKKYPAAAVYLDKSVGKDKWARCFFPGERYNIDTTNCVESINGVFLDARKQPLLVMIDKIVDKLVEWSNKYRKICAETPSEQMLVPFVENEIHAKCVHANVLTVIVLNSYFLEYNVIGSEGGGYLVDLQHKRCSCKRFDIDRYPCVHVIAALMEAVKDERNHIEMHDLCSKYYLMVQWQLAYNRTLYPVPHMSMWVVPDKVRKMVILPKYYEKKKGRPQTRRYKSAGEHGRRQSMFNVFR